jgi:parvulin-like peptidyl-prolyl isomerase
VVKWIGEQPAFNGEKGFDERFYKMFVTEHLRLTPRAFEEEMRDTLTIQKIRTKLRDHASVSDDELKSLYNQENGQKELAAAFLSGESEKAGLTSPTDDELKQLYPIMQGNFQEPSKVKVSFLFVPKEKTDSLKAAFDDKGSLQDLAKKYSLTPVETDYFSAADAVPQIGPVREVLEEAFNLKKDEESGWIQTDRGAYKLKAVDLREGHVPTFEEGKARLMEVYVSQLAAQAAAAKLEKLEEAFKADFEKAIKDNNLQAKKAEELGVGAKRLADVTKTLKQGDVSEPFPVRGGAAVVKVIRESPADAQKFEAEKKEFKEKMLDRKSGEEFETLLESLRKTRLKVNLESMRKLFPEDKSPV